MFESGISFCADKTQFSDYYFWHPKRYILKNPYKLRNGPNLYTPELSRKSIKELLGESVNWEWFHAADAERDDPLNHSKLLRKELIPEIQKVFKKDDLIVDLGGAIADFGFKKRVIANRELLNLNNSVQLDLDHSLPFRDESFDGAFMTETLFYLSEPQQLFDEVLRIIKPGKNFMLCYRDEAGSKGDVKLHWLKDIFPVKIFDGKIACVYPSREELVKRIGEMLVKSGFRGITTKEVTNLGLYSLVTTAQFTDSQDVPVFNELDKDLFKTPKYVEDEMDCPGVE